MASLAERGPAILAPVIWTLLMLGLLFEWSRSSPGPQGRLMFPAVSALSPLLAVGLAPLVPRRWPRLLFGTLLAVLLAVAVWVPYRIIAPPTLCRRA